jgi:hypothetical protein
LEDPGVDGRIILRWVFRKWDWGYGPDRSGPGYGQAAGFCECGNEHSVAKKCSEFLDLLRDGQLLKKDSAPWSK